MTASPSPPTHASAPLWRRGLPFVLAFGLVGYVLWQLDWTAFGRALAEVDHLRFGALVVGFALALLCADTVATVVIYRWTVAPVRYRDFFVLRGASYLPSLLNHHLGQGFLAYFLARAYDAELWRVAGATLVGYAAWAGCILGFGSIALFVAGERLWLPLVVIAGLGYLALLQARPTALAKRRLLAPLFEVGPVRQMLALVARVPHFTVLFLGTWAPFWLFGVEIPFSAAALYIPILMVLVTLPITPQGLGTRDAFSATMFVSYATAASESEKLAQIAAATLSWGVGVTLAEMILGLVLMRTALPRIQGRRAPSEAGAGTAPKSASE